MLNDLPCGTQVFLVTGYTDIPPYTPEMNPIEQIWREIRTQGFKNEAFSTLQKVVDRLSETICNLTADTVKCITARHWILSTI